MFKKKIISLILALCIPLLSITVPAAVVKAETVPSSTSGTVGPNNEIEWSLDTSTKKLTFSLKEGYSVGSIPSYSFHSDSENGQWSNAPWNWGTGIDYRPYVEKISIGSGITGIGAFAFAGMYNLQSFSGLRAKICNYEEGCFAYCKQLTASSIISLSLNTENDVYIGSKAFYLAGSGIDASKQGGLSLSSEYINSITIEEMAFYGCRFFPRKIALSANDINIGERAFEGAYAASGNSYAVLEGLSVTLGGKLDSSGVVYEYPADNISIGYAAFRNSALDNISVYAGKAIKIEGSAFNLAYSPLTTSDTYVEIKSMGCSPSIEFIGDLSSTPIFSGSSINRVTIELGNTDYVVPAGAFENLASLNKLSILGATKIENNNIIKSSNTLGCDVYLSDKIAYEDIASDFKSISTVKGTIVAPLASGAHKYASIKELNFTASDEMDTSAPIISNFSSNSNQTSITFSWNQKKCEQYLIWRSLKDGGFQIIDTVPFYQTKYTDTSVSGGNTYIYKIRSKAGKLSDTQYGEWSNECTYSLMGSGGVSDVSVDCINNRNILKFSGIVGADRYKVYENDILVHTFTSNSDNLYEYTSDTIKYGKTYVYKIVPVKDVSAAEETEGIASTYYYIPKVSLITHNLSCKDNLYGNIMLMWQKDSNCSGYKINKVYSYNGDYSEETISIDNPDMTLYEFKNLPGGSYSFSICSYRDVQLGETSNLVNISVMAKSAPTLSGKVDSNRVALSWTKIPGADQYKIERSEDHENWYYIDSSVSPSYIDDNLLYGHTYYYRMYAVKDKTIYGLTSYNSDMSNEISFKPIIDVGSTTLSITKTTKNSVTLSWKAATNATAYSIYRKVGENSNYELITSVSDLSYVDSNLNDGLTYYYCIKPSRDLCFADSSSNVQSYTTLSLIKPLVDISQVLNSIKLSWDSVIGSDGYYVYKKFNGEYIRVATITDSTVYVDNDVILGCSYYYKVVPFKNVTSEVVVGTETGELKAVVYVALNTPQLQIIKNSDNSVDISWNSVEYATGYILQRKFDSSDWETLIDSKEAFSYHDANKERGVNYSYRVAAVCNTVIGNFSSENVVKFIRNNVDFSLDNNQSLHSAIITILSPQSGETYEIYKKADGGDWTLLTRTSNVSITDADCIRGKTYWYKVRIFENVSDGTIFSNYSSEKTVTFALSVKSSKTTASSLLKGRSVVQISWKSVKEAVRYKVYRKNGKGDWKYIGSTSKCYFTNKNLKAGITYYYKVVPVGVFDEGIYSNTCSVTTLEMKAIKITSKRSKTSIKLSYKKTIGASGYEIYYATNKKVKFKKIASTSKFTYTLKKISKKYTYYCFIRPYKFINGKRYYGKKSYVAILKRR